jgi:hypothetical protein
VMTGQSRRRRERVCTTDHRGAYLTLTYLALEVVAAYLDVAL